MCSVKGHQLLHRSENGSKAMLSEFGNEMPETEKSKLSTQLYALYSQAIEETGDGKGGQGAGT